MWIDQRQAEKLQLNIGTEFQVLNDLLFIYKY